MDRSPLQLKTRNRRQKRQSENTEQKGIQTLVGVGGARAGWSWLAQTQVLVFPWNSPNMSWKFSARQCNLEMSQFLPVCDFVGQKTNLETGVCSRVAILLLFWFKNSQTKYDCQKRLCPFLSSTSSRSKVVWLLTGGGAVSDFHQGIYPHITAVCIGSVFPKKRLSAQKNVTFYCGP